MDLSKTKFAIQGFGNVGSWAAQFIHQMGGIVVAVADLTGGIYNAKGLDIPHLMRYVRENNGVKDFPETVEIAADAIFTCECDVLIPAALGNVITEENMKDIKAKFIIEGANGPTTPAADEYLIQIGKIIVPDIFANAGGVMVSYFEWVQNVQQFRWRLERVNQELKLLMLDSYAEIKHLAKQNECDLRTAAFQLGISRVARATSLRGLENEGFCMLSSPHS